MKLLMSVIPMGVGKVLMAAVCLGSEWFYRFFCDNEASPFNLPTHRFACPSACLPVCPPVCLFQLASGEVLLTILTSNIVGEYRRVFYNYPGPNNEQCHSQTV